MFQEGKGAGLFPKFEGLLHSASSGSNTYEAYQELGLQADSRDYGIVRDVLEAFAIESIVLLTNNPQKIESLSSIGVSLRGTRALLGELHPSNFDYLSTKCEEGGHSLQQLLPSRGDHFFSFFEANRRAKSALIFDADDTLWEDNFYYEKIIDSFSVHAITTEPSLSSKDIRSIIDAAELEVIPKLGGPIGFEESIRLAYERIQKLAGNFPLPEDFFRNMRETLLGIPTDLIEGVTDTIRSLRNRNLIALYTKGLPDIQGRKLRRSGIARMFDAIGFVQEKDEQNLRRFLDELTIRTGATRFMCIGNSLKSDILPAKKIGIFAVHYLNSNTWHMDDNAEMGGFEPDAKISRHHELINLVVNWEAAY